MGCFTALVLARHGAHVTIFERADRLVDRTSCHNEGKIHFGYVYCGNSSLATARTMVQGALQFAPFLDEYLDMLPKRIALSSPFVYVVHADTQRSLDYLSGYFSGVHGLIAEAGGGKANGYFTADLRKPPRRWSASELAAVFNPEKVIAAFDTEELSVDPYELAQAVRDRIAATPAIELRLRHTVQSVAEAGARLRVLADGPDGPARDEYDHVVNALWDGRLKVDASFGIRPKRSWLYRFRYGLRFDRMTLPAIPPSLTLVHGPFGGVVRYSNGGLYLTWYPVCKVNSSNGLEPPGLPAHAEEPLRSRVIGDTVKALTEILPLVGTLDPDAVGDASVVGGNIFAWGSTDTDDPMSELHQRHDIGVVSHGNYHSIDPGKLSLTPHFAQLCADRIVPP